MHQAQSATHRAVASASLAPGRPVSLDSALTGAPGLVVQQTQPLLVRESRHLAALHPEAGRAALQPTGEDLSRHLHAVFRSARGRDVTSGSREDLTYHSRRCSGRDVDEEEKRKEVAEVRGDPQSGRQAVPLCHPVAGFRRPHCSVPRLKGSRKGLVTSLWTTGVLSSFS